MLQHSWTTTLICHLISATRFTILSSTRSSFSTLSLSKAFDMNLRSRHMLFSILTWDRIHKSHFFLSHLQATRFPCCICIVLQWAYISESLKASVFFYLSTSNPKFKSSLRPNRTIRSQKGNEWTLDVINAWIKKIGESHSRRSRSDPTFSDSFLCFVILWR